MGAVEELIALARSVSGGPDPSAALEQIDAAIADSISPLDIGRLQMARSIALQCSPDPNDAADAMLEAVQTLRLTDAYATRAYAAAAGAVTAHRAGDIDRSLELMVDAMMQLDAAEPTAPDALSASNALAQQFAAMSSFDRAAELARGAFLQSTDLPPIVRAHYAISLGFCSVEALRALPADERTSGHDLVRSTLTAASWLETHPSVPSDGLLAAAYRAEIALLLDDPATAEGVGGRLNHDTAEDHPIYDGMGLRLTAYHRLVRAEYAARWGAPIAARQLLERCVPELQQVGDELRLIRALEARVDLRRTIGDLAGATEDALALANQVKEWRARQDRRLARQVSQRADLELTRVRLLSDADRLAREAAVDEVTGVGNRRWFELQIDELSRGSVPVAAVMLDLDNFKEINDHYGHPVGDAILRQVGELLREKVRKTDVIARYGGDEFVVLLSDVDTDKAAELAHRIHDGLSSTDWTTFGANEAVSVSLGVAHGPSRSVRDLIRVADGALYEAKGLGRDRVHIASPSPDPS